MLVLGRGLVRWPGCHWSDRSAWARWRWACSTAHGGAGLLIGSISGRRLNADREPTTFVIGLAGVAVATAAIGISPWFAPIVGFNLLIGLADSLDLIAGQGSVAGNID